MELELIQLPSSKLEQVEYGQFVKEQTTQTGLLPSGTIKDATLIAGLKIVTDDTTEYDKAMVKVTKNELTDEVEVKDVKRDVSIFAINAFIKLGLLSDVEAEIKAAKHLETLFKTYGGIRIAKYNYEKESNTIDNFIADLESADYSDDVALLGMGKYVTRLKTDNKAFKDLFSNRLKGEAGKVYIDSKLAREKLANSYENFVGYVLFNAKLRGGEFVTVLNVLNATRKYYANLLAIREGKKDAKKKKGDEGNAPTQNPGS